MNAMAESQKAKPQLTNGEEGRVQTFSGFEPRYTPQPETIPLPLESFWTPKPENPPFNKEDTMTFDPIELQERSITTNAEFQAQMDDKFDLLTDELLVIIGTELRPLKNQDASVQQETLSAAAEFLHNLHTNDESIDPTHKYSDKTQKFLRKLAYAVNNTLNLKPYYLVQLTPTNNLRAVYPSGSDIIDIFPNSAPEIYKGEDRLSLTAASDYLKEKTSNLHNEVSNALQPYLDEYFPGLTFSFEPTVLDGSSSQGTELPMSELRLRVWDFFNRMKLIFLGTKQGVQEAYDVTQQTYQQAQELRQRFSGRTQNETETEPEIEGSKLSRRWQTYVEEFPQPTERGFEDDLLPLTEDERPFEQSLREDVEATFSLIIDEAEELLDDPSLSAGEITEFIQTSLNEIEELKNEIAQNRLLYFDLNDHFRVITDMIQKLAAEDFIENITPTNYSELINQLNYRQLLTIAQSLPVRDGLILLILSKLNNRAFQDQDLDQFITQKQEKFSALFMPKSTTKVTLAFDRFSPTSAELWEDILTTLEETVNQISDLAKQAGLGIESNQRAS